MDNNDTSPIFVVGSSRSGTTLLYSILVSGGELARYEAETHLLDVCPIRYGNLKNNENKTKFLKDWVRSKPFSRSGLTGKIFLDGIPENCTSYIGMLRYYMDCIAKYQGKRRWADQTPAHVFHLDAILREFPQAKVVHMIRDGRDVAMSRRKTGWTGIKQGGAEEQLLGGAVSWMLSVQTGRNWVRRHKENAIEIKYEDLVSDLDNTLLRLNRFLGMQITMSDIQQSSFGSLRESNTAFVEQVNGITSTAVGRWEASLNMTEKYALHFLLGGRLSDCGYAVDLPRAECAKRLSLSKKLHLMALPPKYRLKRWVKENTYLGRYSQEELPFNNNK